ncbi:hypothetical protein Z949_330 [Sulfitobacter guttiformis KCTC 32187]|nr:hypothetical protein Z949_330 [Sulfitobacter guttiformis KCTC 32187]
MVQLVNCIFHMDELEVMRLKEMERESTAHRIESGLLLRVLLTPLFQKE